MSFHALPKEGVAHVFIDMWRGNGREGEECEERGREGWREWGREKREMDGIERKIMDW